MAKSEGTPQQIGAAIWAAIFAMPTGILILWLTPIAQGMRIHERIGWTTAGLLLTVATLVTLKVPRIVKRVVIALVPLLVATLSTARAFAPSESDLKAEEYFQVCSDPLWGTDPVACYTRSQSHMAANFADYVPDDYHSYAPSFDASDITANELAQGGPTLDGTPIRSVGQVVVTQVLGVNEQVIQLRAPTSESLKSFRWSSVRGYFPRESIQESVIVSPNPAEAKRPADSMIYLSVATRNMFSAEPGEFLVFDGIPVAHGVVLQPRTGRRIPLTYVRGHAVEHLV